MKKQIIAVALAAVLAIAGIFLLVRYAQNADDRARAGTETVEVLIAAQQIPAGTPAEELPELVESVEVQRADLVDDALSSLSGLADQVTNSTLFPGDQLRQGRFGGTEDIIEDPEVPEGMQELALPINGVRLVDGAVSVGDRVGVLATYGDRTANPINDLLILRVNTESGLDNARITVAVDTEDALFLVNAVENGSIWLTRQNPDTDTSGGTTVTPQDVAP